MVWASYLSLAMQFCWWQPSTRAIDLSTQKIHFFRTEGWSAYVQRSKSWILLVMLMSPRKTCFNCPTAVFPCESCAIWSQQQGPRSKVHSPRVPSHCHGPKKVLAAAKIQTEVQDGPKSQNGCKVRCQAERQGSDKEDRVTDTERSAARSGVPKARRAFALYVQKHYTAKKPGLSKEEHKLEMAQLGRKWASLGKPTGISSAKRCVDALGLSSRPGKGLEPVEPQAKVPGPRSTVHSSKIGPFEVQHGPEAALGGGSYGKVFAAYSRDGCFAAVKVYRTHDGEEQAAQEAECYHRLGKMLSMVEREWFPTMLEFDSRGQPWPWLALAFAGQSLADHLHAHGPLPADTCDRFALQLQRALRVLHRQAKLLHLDLKPGNILWCQELEKLKVCDFGFSEPWEINGPQSKVQGPRFIVPNPRFCTYVTGLYRAPELWNLDPQPSLQALQKCLTTSVDLLELWVCGLWGCLC